MAKQTKASAPRPNAGLRQGNKKRQLGNKRRAAKRKVDPVVTEIVRNGVIAVTEEMKTNLMRTAYNMIIYEALDSPPACSRPMARRCRSASACRCSSAAWPRR